MSAQKSKATPIGEILKNVFEGLERGKNLTREDIDSVWISVVQEAAARHSKPAVLRNKVLTIWVDSSVWLQELTLRKRQILKGLKRVLGKDKISEIHFKIGEF